MQLRFRFKDLIFPFLITLISLFLVFCNYVPHTWLAGWDNLLPELNIFVNLKRAFFASWQQYQGLGLNGGMGHATEIIRQLFLLPFIFIFPTSFIRYFFHFLMIIIGPLGLYFGSKKVLHFKPVFAFCSALFYLLSFGSVQNFWVPFEPFSVFFGLFPWLIFSLIKTIDLPNRKNLIIFGLINLIATPSFYVPTVFIVYLLCILSILFWHTIFHFKTKIRTNFKILILIFLINSFWLFPFLHFVKNDSINPQLGIGNQIASEETVQRNQARGNISDFLLLRGYYYDLQDSTFNLMVVWHEHFDQPLVIPAGYFVSAFVLIGLFNLIKKYKDNLSLYLGLISIFLICAIALLSNTQPFTFINEIIRSLPLIDQVFRSPFTKFITPSIFIFAILIGYGLELVDKFIAHKFKFILVGIFSISLIYFSWPSFSGNYIYPQMKQSIPQEYFDMISYFKTQPKDGRIANLPSGKFWGWTSYRFGMHGSGFIWYGIEQPILDRAFDVWNLKNEQYYWELTYALQKQDPVILENIIKKYNISYLIFDNNVFFLGDQVYSQVAFGTKNLIDQIPSLKKEKEFGKITIYKYNSHPSVFTVSQSQNISISQFSYFDPAFSKSQNYYTDKPSLITFPFSGLFTSRLPNEIPFTIQIQDNLLTLTDQKNNFTYKSNVSQIFEYKPQGEYLRMDTNVSKEFFVPQFENIFFNKSYLLKIDYRHVKGYPLLLAGFDVDHHFYFFNTRLNKNADWSTAWFVVPQQENFPSNSNLDILFNNTTFNQQNSINDIKSIKVYSLPFEEIINNYFPQIPLTPSTSQDITIQNSGIFYNKVKVDTPTVDTKIVLSQSFHKSWLAFYFKNGTPHFLKHILINNWANGWNLTNQEPATIYIIFWPQVLEFIGLIILPITFWKLVKKR